MDVKRVLEVFADGLPDVDQEVVHRAALNAPELGLLHLHLLRGPTQNVRFINLASEFRARYVSEVVH